MTARRVRTALVGCGKVGHTHAQALASLSESEFVAVCHPDAAKAARFGAQYGARPFTNLSEMLDVERVEMVSVCTPHPLHPEAVVECAARGVHALVEKPLAPDLAGCDRAIEAARRGGVKLGVISQRRLYRPVIRMREAILSGAIGTPALATLAVLGWRDESYYRSDPWRGRWELEGGGVMVNQAPHQLDLLQWLMGPLAELSGYWDNLNHPSIEVEDTAVAVIRFTSGALGSVVLSNSQKPGLYGRLQVHGANGGSVGVQTDAGSSFVSGVTATVEPPITDLWTVPGEADRLAGLQADDREAVAEVDVMTWYHRLQIADFLKAIIEDRAPMVDGEEGRKVVEIIHGDLSVAAGRAAGALSAGDRGGPWRLRRTDRPAAVQPRRAGTAMKALVLTDYNRLEYLDVADPEPGPDEVLIRVGACGICGSDVHGVDGSTGRRVPPLIMGHEAAGMIVETGRLVGDWQAGQRVTFDSTIFCGACEFCRQGLVNLCDRRRVFGVAHAAYRQDGAFAELVAVPSRLLHSLPDGLTYVEGTVVEPLSIAMHAASLAPVGRETDVVVVGCGVIGLLLIQVLKARGCRQILAVDLDPHRLQLAASLGADVTLRSDIDDVTAEVGRLTTGRGPAVAFEAVGISATVGLAVSLVRKGGTVVLVGNVMAVVDLALQDVVTRQLTLHGSAASSGEYPAAIDLLAGRGVAVNEIISAVAPLRDGPSWFARLQQGSEPLVKVILEP